MAPKVIHLQVAKRILKYVNGTKSMEICTPKIMISS